MHHLRVTLLSNLTHRLNVSPSRMGTSPQLYRADTTTANPVSDLASSELRKLRGGDTWLGMIVSAKWLVSSHNSDIKIKR